ncbi:alpha/beta-hydrolase, partial [Polychaeton citri CBS 116435]
IDHVLGRPSTRFRKYQVFTVVLLWSLYLWRGDRHGPPKLRKLSTFFSKRLTAWQTLVVTLLYLYVSKNLGRIVGLESPEPLANLYTRSYFRATWITTALDAGFWTAMNLRPKWLRDFASMAFSVYYLVCAEQADVKVRKVRGSLTLQHLRVSWNKPTTPYLSAVTRLLRPRLMRYPPRRLRIARPQASSYSEPIDAWLYFDGPIGALKNHDKIILDIPGGGFVAMDPRCHDDKLLAWGGRTGLPVLALNYRKAPEFPYPYGLNECYDAYHKIITSRGRCIGLSGAMAPKVIVSGDSAGGNLAVGMVMMLLQTAPHSSYFPGETNHRLQLPLPEALICVYPALDMNIGNWMTDEQMALIKAPERRSANKGVLRRKSDDYRKLTPDTPHGSDDEDEGLRLKIPSPPNRRSASKSGLFLKDQPLATESPSTITVKAEDESFAGAAHQMSKDSISASITPTQQKPQPLRTRLAMSSMISYFNDRILTPEMLRAMIVLYIGPYNRPDFATDYLLSPLLAPESLLARFPKTYFLTGERDPLVDDTVVFAGRLRQAKLQRWKERQELGLISDRERFRESDHVETLLVPGISHGFLQFVSVFPEGWKYILQCSRWMKEVFQEADRREAAGEGYGGGNSLAPTPAAETSSAVIDGGNDYFSHIKDTEHKHAMRQRRAESSGDEDRPLEMRSMLSMTARRPSGKENQTWNNGRPTNGRLKPGADRASVTGRGSVKKPSFSGRKSPIATRKSLVSLASTDDLMSRRMKAMTGGLMGD